MSMEGCLRSLLYESLSRCPDLAHVVFPDLWEAFNLFNIPPTATWTMPQLQRGFDRLLCQANRDRRLFFLIDGLDEFGEDHAVLITMIEKICARPNVKLCVSSRPWIEFEDAFIAKPTLRLEDLTYPDIKHFISSKLESHPAFGKLKKEEPIFTKDLVESTTKKSSGVFLWVSLVVKSLMTGMANGDRVVELEQRLIALPADLEGLFNKILQSVEGTYKMDASHLIQLVRSSREPITLLRLFFADEANVAAALKYPVGKISAEEEDTKCERMRRRLNSRCKGLLEASGHGRWSQKTVGYLHRTVREWIEKPETWGKILAATRDDFDPSLELAKSYLLLLKARGNSSSHDIWRYAMPCIMYASESNSSMDCIVALLDGLDNAASTAFSPTSAQALQQFHWCATNHSSTEVDDFPSFLHLAVKLQLDWYLRVKLGFIQSTNHVRGPPLLLSAILDYNQVHFQFLPKEMQDKVPRRPSPDTVKLLLEAGETPNQKYRGSTPWKKVIERTTTDGWMPPWRQIVPLFVQHGADIKAPLELQSVLSEDKRQVWIEEIKRWKKEGNFRETSRNPVSARRFSRVLFPFRSG
ncbi:hypothetical protein BJY04DRAFT_183164 [Aspergillus karnatakaensis]|uniref:uncharacterized protein n=1 Tax=Aspergillus karnatakaensis TaxID=1810916 RepID=UPI003CCD9B1D